MSTILPFRAVRARPIYASRFAASAFDAEIREEVFERQKHNPYSYLRILNPQAFTDEKLKKEECHSRSRKKYEELLKEDILEQDSEGGLYLYRQLKDNHTFTAVIGLASLEEFRSGKIKKHEHTRTEKEDGMVSFFKNVGINANPVLLTYREVPKLSRLFHELAEPAPVYHFISDDDSEHFLWLLNRQESIQTIQEYFSKVQYLYIADGHHRCAAISEMNEQPLDSAPGFMACFIADSEVKVHSFSRYVTDFSGMSLEDFILRLREKFSVEMSPLMHPDPMPGKIDFYAGGHWYTLRIAESLKKNENPTENLDVSILDKKVLNKILGIEDVRKSDRVFFSAGNVSTDMLVQPVDSGTFSIVFALSAVEIQDVIRISNYGEVMPPKSTWIEPKLHSGLLIQNLIQ